MSYAIGTDFCLEHTESFQGGINIHCHLSNTPVPSPTFKIIAVRIGDNSSVTLLSGKRGYLFLNKTVLETLFDNDTIVVNVTCKASNSFGSDELTTSIRVCGEYIVY